MISDIKAIKEDDKVNIAIVGKYVSLEDSYLSVVESLKHGGFANHVNVKIDFVDSEEIKNDECYTRQHSLYSFLQLHHMIMYS